ncbi:hypothetical protein M0R45_013780 [Rubus argutus]|uniref:Homeobox domain-containing protein n=1 Tax=Rubus argutus TaxID=59490 RepID=A0AAW1XJD1_RUBAR
MLEPAIQTIDSTSNAIVPYVNPEPGLAQGAPLRKTFTQQQRQALQEFIVTYPKPTDRQKLVFSEQIGLTVAQISAWVARKRTQKNAQTARQEFYFQQKRKIGDLQAQLRQYQEAFNKITCPHCGNHVAPSLEPSLRIDGAPPQPEIQQMTSTIDPRKKSRKGKAAMDSSSDPVHSSSTHMPSSNVHSSVHEQSSVMTDKVSGFSIQPDMLASRTVDAQPDNPSLGSLVTIGTQISTELLPRRKGSVYQVCQLVQGTIERIQSAVINN